jgi:hypothetical protein
MSPRWAASCDVFETESDPGGTYHFMSLLYPAWNPLLTKAVASCGQLPIFFLNIPLPQYDCSLSNF